MSHQDGVVSCGRVIPGHRLTVRSPDGTRPADGEPGEVWVSGPSVSRGYWDSPDASREAFTTDESGERVLRTGDLGFLQDGELYVTGRAKDLIIVRGRNVAAADAEWAVADCHPQVRRGSVAAFGVDQGAGEELVVLAELRRYANVNPAEIRAAIQAALAGHLGVTAHQVLLGRRGSVLKTPSGKIRRAECRIRFLAGELALLREDAGDPAPPGGSRAAEIAALATAVLGAAAGPIGPGTSLTGAGMDSLRAVELTHAARERLRLELPLAALLGGATPGQLAVAAASPGEVADDAGLPRDKVTDGERALWVTSRLSGDPAHYVLTIAAELRAGADSAAVDAGLVTDVLRLLRRRHPVLRTYFPEVAGQPVRAVHQEAPELTVADLAGQDAAERWISEFEARGLDPSRSAPWKAALLRPAGAPALLVLCVHHMICDLWSLDILRREFAAAYTALEHGDLPRWTAAADPGRLAARRDAELSGEAGERLAAFWRAGSPARRRPAGSIRPRRATWPGPRRALPGAPAWLPHRPDSRDGPAAAGDRLHRPAHRLRLAAAPLQRRPAARPRRPGTWAGSILSRRRPSATSSTRCRWCARSTRRRTSRHICRRCGAGSPPSWPTRITRTSGSSTTGGRAGARRASAFCCYSSRPPMALRRLDGGRCSPPPWCASGPRPSS